MGKPFIYQKVYFLFQALLASSCASTARKQLEGLSFLPSPIPTRRAGVQRTCVAGKLRASSSPQGHFAYQFVCTHKLKDRKTALLLQCKHTLTHVHADEKKHRPASYRPFSPPPPHTAHGPTLLASLLKLPVLSVLSVP